MSEPFLGEIQTFAVNFAPRGYVMCNGALLPIAQNTALFSLLGTIYGGDGRTTFGLPNLQDRTPIHPGRGPGLTSISLGEQLGSDSHTLTIANIPPHTHAIGAVTLPTSDAAATLSSPVGSFPAQPAEFAYGDDTDAKASITSPPNTEVTGTSQPIDNKKPYQKLIFVIATVGIFPSRS